MTGVSNISDHPRPSFDLFPPNCFGGTCIPIDFGDPLWQEAWAEATVLQLDSRQICQDLGAAIGNMLDRHALYLRIEGPTSTGVAGHYDFTQQFYPIEEGDAFVKFGEAWITEGTHISAEDGAAMAPMDKLRHEAAHSLIDWAYDVTGNTGFGDADSETTQTAQQISQECRNFQ